MPEPGEAPAPAPTPALKPLPMAPAALAGPAGPRKGPRWPWLDRARLFVQAAVLAGFVAQALLYHVWNVRPLGNLLPFVAYESLGRTVVSSALLAWGALFVLTAIFGRFVCGWLCPLGFFQEAGERLLRRLGAKLPPPTSQPRLSRGLLAAVVIASPLPDEIGVALLSTTTRLSQRAFVILCFAVNTLGILAILLLASALHS